MRHVRDVLDAMAAEMARSPLLSFGKWRGHRLREVAARDPQYIQWLLQQPWFRLQNPELYREAITELSARR